MKQAIEEIFSSLKNRFRGDLVRPGDAEYPTARGIWNGMAARAPGLIARCAGVPDVQAAVRAAFGYDEADYAFEAKLGLAANYTDTPTLPLMDFLRDGLGRYGIRAAFGDTMNHEMEEGVEARGCDIRIARQVGSAVKQTVGAISFTQAGP